MGELKYPNQSTYYIANSIDKKVIHYGITHPNQVTTTGQPLFNIFVTKVACETMLKTDLKITNVQLAENPLPDMKITKWGDKVVYKIGNVVLFNDKLYICLKNHTATKDLYPDSAKALWELYIEKANILITTEITKP